VVSAISFLIVKEKKLLNNLKYILLIFLSGLLAIFTGILGGLILTAYLTTKPNQSSSLHHPEE